MLNFLKQIVIFCCLFISLSGMSQFDNFLSKSSISFNAGGSYYLGDLNKVGHFKNTNLSAALLYKHNFNSRVALRVGLSYGKVEAYDEDATSDFQQNRNLSFESPIWELASGFEFNYFNYKIGNKQYYATPFLFVGLGIVRINPQTEFNGELVELQPLGTEGQGTSLSGNKLYNLTQIVIPFGVGFKVNLGEKTAFNIEYGLRKTFTDYIDDVSGSYVNPNQLALENGNIAAALSDRSLEGERSFGARGNDATNDWYALFNLGITFRLGKETRCAFQ